MKSPAGLDDLSTLDWLREALEVSPDAFAVHHLVRDDAGCFRALEAHGGAGAGDARLLAARVLASRLLDTIGQGATVVGFADARVQALNHAFARLLGVDPERMLDAPLGSVLDNRAARLSVEGWLAELRTEPRVAPLRLPLDGERLLLLEALRIHRTGFVLVLARDVASPHLAPVDSTLRAELLGATDAVAMVDTNGTLVFASPGLHELMGYGDGELHGRSVDLLVPEHRRDHHAESRAQVFASGERTMQGEGFNARRRDGTTVTIGMSMSRLTVGDRPLMLCFVSDLDRRRAATDRLRDYQEHLRRLSFDLAVAAEQERRKVAVELHDCLGQALALAKLKLVALEHAVPETARAALADVIRLVDQCAADTRTLTFQLSPPVLYDLGLAAAFDWLKDDLRLRCGFVVEVDDRASPLSLEPTTAAVAFRAVRELLMNVVKHAKTSHAKLTLTRHQEVLVIAVADEGIGFEPLVVDAGAARRFGLASVREQLNRLGGRLEVRSAPGRGAYVEVQLPML